MHDDPRRPLHDRLDDHPGDLPRMRGEQPIHLLQASDPAPRPLQAERASVAEGDRRPEHRKEQGLEHEVKPIDPPQAHIPERISVVRPAKRNEGRPLQLRFGLLSPVLKRHLQRHLDRRRAVV